MGIPGLWELLDKTLQTRTLTQLAVNEGFEINRRGDRTVAFGVDASQILTCAQWAAYHQKKQGINMQAGENLPLQILFFQLCRFLALPVKLVFVFDGPNRPTVKRGRKVKVAPHALMPAYMRLIKDAGFHTYVAPGEAEAELAQLNVRGGIDAVITDDVDAFLFGATHVIRPSNVAKNGDYVNIYSLEDIRIHQATRLTVPRILLMAILSGGDYGEGLKGCGTSIAHALSTGTSLADDLYTAACDLPHLSDFLPGWRNSLRHHLTKDPNQILGRRYPAVARNILSNFPHSNVLEQYVHPTTSWSDDGAGPDIVWQSNKQPDLPALAVWCEKYFSWGTNGHILDRFRNNVWRGICIRSLMTPVDITTAIAVHVSNGISDATILRPAILQINRASLGPDSPSKRPDTWGYRVQVKPHSLILITLSRLTPEIRNTATSQPQKSLIIWVPAPILKFALPKLVGRFHAAKDITQFKQPVHVPVLSVVSKTDCVGNSIGPSTGDITSRVRGSGTARDPIMLDEADEEEAGGSGELVQGASTRLDFLFAALETILQ